MLKLVNSDIGNFIRFLKLEKKNIYFWGAGVLLQICMAYLIELNHLYGQIVLCADSDKEKEGKHILIYGKKIPVTNPDKMIKAVKADPYAVIVITCSYFKEIIEKLDSTSELDGKLCYILPFMYLGHPELESRHLELGKTVHIPQRIHYCWFGDNKLKNKECIDSWKKYCPGYEIIEWNEQNIKECNSAWTAYMFKNKKWALLSDYVRAYALYHYGGFYFDVDVMLYRKVEDLRRLEAFSSFERWPVINTGGGCGSAAFFWYWQKIMKLRDRMFQDHTDLVYPLASGFYDTLPLLHKGLKADGKLQTIDGFTVLPSEYFHPFDYVSKTVNVTEKTYGIHYFSWSWADEKMLKGMSKEKNEYQILIDRMEECL